MEPTATDMIDQYIGILKTADRPGLTLFVREASAAAIRAAIGALEFKRAARPKDEAAERALCKRAAEDIIGWPEPEAAEEVHVLRAQARAEGSTAKHAELLPKFKEQERLSLDLIAGRDARIAALTAQLSAAQAEIERLETLFQNTQGELETKEGLASALLAAALIMFWRGLFPSWAVLRRNWVWAVLLVECWVLAVLVGVVIR